MILDRRKIIHGSQEDIGYDLGLTVPEDKAGLFKRVRIGKKPSAGYGTKVSTPRYSINHYFKKYRIYLKEEYYPIRKVHDIKKFIATNLKNNNDVIVCFNNKRLHGIGDYGHVSLIQDINKGYLTIIDPGINVPKIRRVRLSKLIDAIEHHGEKNRAGFWIISKRISQHS
jgi:hypothetical protein